VITLLDAYHLTRDDQKSVDDLVVRSMAICAFLRIVINFQHLKLPGTEEPEPPVDSKVRASGTSNTHHSAHGCANIQTKAALTRAYNKKVRLMPYTNIAVNKSRRAAFVEAEGFVEEENEVKSGDDGDGADAMVIVKKPSKAAGTVAASVSSARGAGCGRGGKAK
jgi:hypothetical protein